MDFLKKHYEKVLLSAVLLGLAVAAALLPLKVAKVRDEISEIKARWATPSNPKLYKVTNLSTNAPVVARLQAPVRVELAGRGHNLFNPVQWKRTPEGKLIPIRTGTEFGAGAISASEIRPLHLIVSFDGIGGTPESPKYIFTLEQQTNSPPKRASRQAAIGLKNDLFTLLALRPEGNPTQADLQIGNERDVVTVQKDQPYTRVMGFEADLEHKPTKQTFKGKRINDKLTLTGDSDTYKIVAITANEVVLSASSTQKRTTIRYGGAPSK